MQITFKMAVVSETEKMRENVVWGKTRDKGDQNMDKVLAEILILSIIHKG